MNSPHPNPQPPGTEDGVAPVQRGNFEPATLDRIARQDRDGRIAATHLSRLEGDANLYARLQFASFEGPDWDKFERELVRYGFAVLRAWIATGVIAARVQERAHKRLARPPVELTQQDAEDLAADTIVRALEKFRIGVLGTGKWDPKKGASLKTFWIGFCVLKYPDLYDNWCTDQRHWLAGINEAQQRLPSEVAQYDDPQRRVDLDSTIQAALTSLPETTAKILVLKELGYEHTEIAELLDLTVKSIESRLHRHRKATNAA